MQPLDPFRGYNNMFNKHLKAFQNVTYLYHTHPVDKPERDAFDFSYLNPIFFLFFNSLILKLTDLYFILFHLKCENLR